MKLAVVSGDQEEALRVESGRRASIASVVVVAGLDADALALEPGGEGCELQVVSCRLGFSEGMELAVEGEEDGGGERLAAQWGRGTGEGGMRQFAAERGGDGFEFRREAGVVEVDADADDGITEHGGQRRRGGGGGGGDEGG